MDISPPHWSWLAVFSCLLLMGREVRCECSLNGVEMDGGDYTLTKKLQHGSMMVYNCPEGYYPYPAFTRVCQLNNKWKPLPKKFLRQRCRLVECPDPNVMEFGSVSPPQERYFVGNETMYECYSGYSMRGSPSRMCLKNGKWSGFTPICSRDTDVGCADPGVPAGASRTGNAFGIDDRVTYTCNSNLFLVGSKTRVCQENGQWTGKEPACYYKYTYDTPLEVSEAFGSAITETLTTLEDSDDTQQGRIIRIPKNGTLNIYIAVDISESIEPKHFEDARDAIIKLLIKISSFSVTPNYEILFFSSEVFEVVSILDFFDGKVTLNTVRSELEKFTIGDRNTGTDLSLALTTIWERISLIRHRVGDEAFKEHRHAIILFTDGAYNMGGAPGPVLARIKNMVYMNHTTEEETSSREEYLDIYVFAIGAEIFDSDLEPLALGKGGQHYFRLADIKNLQQTFDEIIDEDAVKGLCGLHREYDTPDKASTRRRFPWYAFIEVNNDGRIKSCFGSLVSPKFVLTAAHCFRFGDLPEHVKVEIDDGQKLVKKVKTFRIHPKYNLTLKVDEGVKEFYDHDVALIQLEKAVHISNAVRPICIPCTQETSDALKLVGKSTCQQQEELMLRSHIERLSFLTRKQNTVDEKDVHAKLGDYRAGCIQHALGAVGITTTDPNVAVTENFLCTGGRAPVRDHIACTGDSGGAVFKHFEHRTIQVGVVSWGTKALCRKGGLVESDDTSRDFHINLFRVAPFLKTVLGDDNQDDFAPLQFLES